MAVNRRQQGEQGGGSKQSTVGAAHRLHRGPSSFSGVAALKMKVETLRNMRRPRGGPADGDTSLTSSMLFRLLRFSPAERLPRLLKNRDIPSMISPPYFADIHQARWPGRLELAQTVWGRQTAMWALVARRICLRPKAKRMRGVGCG